MSHSVVMSPSEISDGLTTPDEDAPLKRKFGTVEPARPTPAKKRVATFVDPHYARRGQETTKQRIARAAKEAMTIYDYNDCPLPDGHIRLLFLKPDTDPNADIVVELRSFAVDEITDSPEDHQFTALSYNWGEGDESKIVLIDMEADDGPAPKPKINEFSEVVTQFKKRMRRMNIKPNLYAFLLEFRDRQNEVALWVDRICINQQSNAEKADQVSRMSMIYSTATNVSIWLGPADEDLKTDRAMDFIGFILQDDVGGKLSDNYAKDWSELLYLMRRRWFSRRWIIQELALAKNAEVRCGSKRNHWRDFSDAVSVFALHFDTILKIIKSKPELEKSLEGIKDMRPLGARILVDVLSNTFQRRADGTIYAPRQGLENLVSSLSTFETSDPRDTIYTLLNLAKETFELPSISTELNGQKKRRTIMENPPPVPDYTVDLLEVYTNFVKWCVKESNSLDILCRYWALPELKQKLDEFYPRLVVLPSWIKTVRDSAYGAQIEGFGGRRTGDSFVGTPANRCYNASSDMRPQISFGRDQPGPIQQEKQNRTSFDDIGKERPTPSRRLRSFARSHRVQRPPLDLNSSITVKGICIGKVMSQSLMLEGIIPKQVLKSLGHDGDSAELEGVSDTVWRTLVADRDPEGKAPPAWYHRACMTCLVADTKFGNIDTNSILQQDDMATLKADYLKRVQAVCWNRTFIECDGRDGEEKRLFGIGPGDTLANDLVCILFGCSVPCILRPTWRGSGDEYTPDYYELVGEAFILGQMDGEAITDLTEEERKGEHFRLM
ncbi:heterokaryon incompatibility protein-domain-containing protein [Hypoxylon sp. NC1633]|nr:heterokaryon incompatibility protein-domain-containing protein [Hypoxylon sp. NC1633]